MRSWRPAWLVIALASIVAGCPVAPSGGLQPSAGPRRSPKPTPSPSSTASEAASPPASVLAATTAPPASPTTAASAVPSGTPPPPSPPDPAATPTPRLYVVSTLAGSTAGLVDATGEQARFANPNGLELMPSGDLYVADAGNHRIRKITPAGEVSTFAGTERGLRDAAAAAAAFDGPFGVASGPGGVLYVADTSNHCIRKIEGGMVSTVAGDGQPGFVDGDGAAARFAQPFSVVVGGDGNLYVADAGNHAIRRISPAGKVSTLVGGVAGMTNGNFATAKLAVPTDLVFDDRGRLYVADSNNHNVRRIDLALGVMNTLAGSGTPGFTDERGVRAKFNAPTGLCWDAGSASLIVADSNNHAIRRVDLEGDVETIAGGTRGFIEGTAGIRFDIPTDVAVRDDGTILVADTKNQRIRQLK